MIFPPSLFVRSDCVHKSCDLNTNVKLQKTSETTKSFGALKAIYNFVQCNPLLKYRTIFHHGSCSHVLGNEKVHAYQVPSQKKKQAQFYERLTQTLRNSLYFLVEQKVLILESFRGLRTQFQSQRLVMLRSDVFVTADGQISPESFDVTK